MTDVYGRVPWDSFRLSPGAWEEAGTEEGMARMGELMSQLPVIELEELLMESNEPNGDQYVPVPTEQEKATSAVQKVVEDLEAGRVPDVTTKLTSHTIHYESPAGNTSPLPAAICSCGWVKKHTRYRTLVQKALKHEQETGHMMVRGKNEPAE